MAISFQLVIVLLILFIVNMYLISKKKYDALFSFAFVLLLFIPSDAVGIITGYPYSSGGKINLSIIGYEILLIIVCLFLNGKSKIKNMSRVSFGVVAGTPIFLFIFRLLMDGTETLSNKMLDNYLFPAMFAILIVSFLPQNDFPKIMRTFYFCILVNAVIAITEVIYGKSVFFHDYYMNSNAWYQGLYNSTMWNVRMRGTALLGHPLINGMYCVLGIVYLYNRERRQKKCTWMFEFIILVGGVLASNSRGALLIFVGYTAYFILKKKEYGKASVIVLIIMIAVSLMDFASIYQGMFSRDATGSSIMHRFVSLAKFWELPFEVIIKGVGYNNTASILRSIGVTGNLEISYLIVLLENGVIGFSMWLLSLLCLYKKKMLYKCGDLNSRSLINGLILCMMGLSVSGNYFGDPGTLNYTLWAIFAFSYQQNYRQRRLI